MQITTAMHVRDGKPIRSTQSSKFTPTWAIHAHQPTMQHIEYDEASHELQCTRGSCTIGSSEQNKCHPQIVAASIHSIKIQVQMKELKCQTLGAAASACDCTYVLTRN